MMAYSFPLTRAQFMDLLPVQEMTFDLPEAMEVSETGAGEILTAELGTRLWSGEIRLGDMTPDEAAEALAMIDVLRQPGASFMVHDIARPFPRSDLSEAALAGAAPKLSAVHANNREIRISGLTPGYQLRRFDSLAFTYAANPLRYALHRIASPATADASGLTGYFEVSPNIRPGWVTGTAVSLSRAACKAILVPKSVQPGRRRHTLTTGASFRWVQTLR
jgi:hypothetical protein